MPFYVYIIYSPDFDKFYIGQTNDFNERLKRHNRGFEKSTAPYKPWILKFYVEKHNRSEAMVLEQKLKNLNLDLLITMWRYSLMENMD